MAGGARGGRRGSLWIGNRARPTGPAEGISGGWRALTPRPGHASRREWSAMRFEDQHIVVTGGTRGIGRAVTLAFLAEGVTSTPPTGATRRPPGPSRTPRAPTPRASISRPSTRPTTRPRPTSGGARGHPGVGARRQLRDPPGRDPRHDVARRLGRRPARQPHRRVRDGEVRRAEHDAAALRPDPLHDVAGRPLRLRGAGQLLGVEGRTVGLMRSLCKEVAKRKITVNCVSPGFIATELLDDLPDALRDEYRKSVPASDSGRRRRSPPRSSTSRPPRRRTSPARPSTSPEDSEP